MKGRLLLFDLGFFGAALFHGIAEHGVNIGYVTNLPPSTIHAHAA